MGLKLPRVDLIVERDGQQRTIEGTPTEGANVYNLRGCPRCPRGWTVVSTVMVPGKLQ